MRLNSLTTIFHTLFSGLLIASSVHAVSQTTTTPAQNAPVVVDRTAERAGTPASLIPAIAPVGDSIDERARRAAAIEDAKLRADQEKLTPKPSMALNPQARLAPVKVPVPRAELYVEAIRGYPGSLEAVVVINGKFATASMAHPSLADGWTISSITQDGVSVSGGKDGKDRRSLAFVGPEPYMPVKTTGSAGSAAAFNPSTGAAIPQGRPMPMPIGVIGR